MSPDRSFELPGGLAPEEERAILKALERYFIEESPHPWEWVLAGRMDSTGHGGLQVRRLTDAPWRTGGWTRFSRAGLQPPLYGRGDVR